MTGRMLDAWLVEPLAVVLIALFLIWMLYTTRQVWPRRATGQGRIYRCGNCQQIYVQAKDLPLAACPACGKYNEAINR